jgi:predicted O-linked N-acetylglucosamine transferase (SPINDLY family)
MGRLPEAIALYQRVIALAPTFFEAHANLGNALREAGQIEPAIVSYREALRLRPDLAECHLNLASGLVSIGLVDESLTESQIAIDLKPQLEEAHTTRLLALQYRLVPPAEVLEAHRQWARLLDGRLPPAPETEVPELPTALETAAAAAPPARLRVGFISADFFDHPIAYFLEPLLAAHDRDRLELTCYSGVVRADEFTSRLQASADRWRDIRGLSHQRVAALIAEDGIEILVDLAGHTTGSRLPVLALKPAPVQVSYLGYPSTTGLSTIGYRLTDIYADPPGLTEAQYVETLIRLPRTLACYAPPLGAPEVGELPAARPDRAGTIAFASFSSLSKIAPETVDLWARTLQAVPRSRLVIMARGAGGTEFEKRIRAAFAAEGVDPTRIELRPSAAIGEYLAYHNEVDIVLDTFPFNGHTTLCHALWMGVPVVSLAGDRFASRLGQSVLSNVGLAKLVAESPERFTQIAVDLAGNLAELAELRRGLRRQMSQSPLMDAQQFAVDFEQALRQIWASRR